MLAVMKEGGRDDVGRGQRRSLMLLLTTRSAMAMRGGDRVGEASDGEYLSY